MTSRDFTFLTLRNLSAYETNGAPVADNYILTMSSGKQNWTRNLNVNSIIASTISVNSILFPNCNINLGQNAGSTMQGQNAIAIGCHAGQSSQSSNAVAIGIDAGYINQGEIV